MSDRPSDQAVAATASQATSVDRSEATAEGDPVAALRALTGLDDPARAHCPSCGSGVLAVSTARWGCPECGFTVPGARFVLIDDASRPSERRWRRLLTWFWWAAFAYICAWISLTALFRPAGMLQLFIQVFGFVACGVNVWMGRRWRLSPATILTDEGIWRVVDGETRRLVPWADVGSWAWTTDASGNADVYFRRRDATDLADVVVHRATADRVRAHLDEHVSDAFVP